MQGSLWLAIGIAVIAGAGCVPPVTASPVPRQPVVIVAGTYASGPLADITYATLAGRLKADGHQTFMFGLPNL
jgi:multidrug efflux pump subunit AcrA (membrane-fusion protein)